MKTPRILGALILAVLLVTAMTGCSTPAYAVEGTVESVSQDQDGITIVVDGKTIFIPEDEVAGTLAEGATVKIEFEVEDNGSLVAVEIEIEDDEDIDDYKDTDEGVDDDREIKGTIESLSDTSLVINGQTIAIDEDTEIEGILEDGSFVEVKYRKIDGSLVAVEIEIEDDEDIDDDKDTDEDIDDDREIKGTIESLSDTSLVINGQTIAIDEDTEIEGILEDGSFVEVKYRKIDGSLVALEIEVEDDEDIDDDAHEEDGSEDEDVDDDDDSDSDDD